MTIPSGTKLGPYELIAPLGAGGMGEVYRARDTKLGRDVALKVLPEAFASDAERMARFQREAKLLASLNHTNIAAIYGLEDSGSTHALVMELVPGPTLAQRIKNGPLPMDEALRISRQMAEALEYAHERGIVHRDLKPANIKVTRDDCVKILDFGLAKAVQGEADDTDIGNSPTISQMATQTGVLLGTAAYMSPEQAKAKPVDRRADIWAFGCVLFEMLTARKTFGAETVSDTLAAILRADPDWSLLPTATPIRVRVLLQRCLQKDPKQRLRDIGDARISLDEVLSGTADPIAAVSAASGRKPWSLWLAWGTATLFIAAFLAAVLVQTKSPPAAQMDPVRFEVRLPEKLTGDSTGTFALSPDGRKLAFAARVPGGGVQLWVRSMDSLDARPLPGSETSTDSAGFPPFFWSPDSRYVAFGIGGKLERIDTTAGEPQEICDIHGAAVGGSWSRDGVIIFPQAPGPIMKVAANGGSPVPVTAAPTGNGTVADVFPYFLPDGRHFLYVHISGTPGETGIYVGSIDAKPQDQPRKKLLSENSSVVYVPSLEEDVGHLLFVGNGQLLARPFDAGRLELTGEPVIVAEHVGTFGGFGFFSVSDRGILVYRTGGQEQEQQLTLFDRQGKSLGVTGDPGDFLTVALSPDGKRAAYVSLSGQNLTYDLWLADILRNTSTRLTFGASPAGPVWSPGGNRVAFSSGGSSGSNLYEKSANGAEGQQLLLKSDTGTIPTSWSHDGRFLLFTSTTAPTKDDLWVLPLEGDKRPQPFLRTQFNERDASFSPDGHSVAYTSDESGREEVYVRPFFQAPNGKTALPGAKWLISSSGGIQPRWRGDGKELYYAAPNRDIMAVSITAQPAFEAGVPKALFRMPVTGGPALGSKWDVTADGQRFLIAAPAAASATTPFTVVLNWQTALKR
ncbi:MAG: protein kinase domain-containing protein [Candidatus Acidiferrales bacterium]